MGPGCFWGVKCTSIYLRCANCARNASRWMYRIEDSAIGADAAWSFWDVSLGDQFFAHFLHGMFAGICFLGHGAIAFGRFLFQFQGNVFAALFWGEVAAVEVEFQGEEAFLFMGEAWADYEGDFSKSQINRNAEAVGAVDHAPIPVEDDGDDDLALVLDGLGQSLVLLVREVPE